MSLRDDERGQAIQVGAVLLFAILIIAFSSYQAVIIPADNRRVEFNHNQEVQEQLAELRSAVLATAQANGPQSVSVALGTQYPSRTLGLNPNPPSGSLRSVGTTDPLVNVTIENAVATHDDVDDFWNGGARNYSTGAIRYSPNYNQYDEAPTTTYEHSVLSNRFPGGNELVLANQTLIDGDRISIVTLNGSLDRTSSRSTSVDVRPVSSSSEMIQIENSSNEPITISFTSLRNQSAWERTFGADADVIVDESPSPAGSDYHRIHVELDDGSYRLAMMKAAVGTGATKTDEAYLTTVDADASVRRGENATVTLAVRDAYNNPVGGVPVTSSIDGTETSDEDGRVTFTYDTTGVNTGTKQLDFTSQDPSVLSSSTFNASTPENVTATVEVNTPANGSGDGAYALAWTDPSDETANDPGTLSPCDDERCTWDVGANGDTTLTLNATLSPAFEGIDLDFHSNDTSVATVSPSEGTTWSDGAVRIDLEASEAGTAAVLATGNGVSDLITINATGIASDPGPPGLLAYDDADQNGQYDQGETTYTRSDLEAGLDDDGVDLVIPADVGTVSSSSVSISTNSITSSVDLEATNGNLELSASGGTLDLGRGSVSATNGVISLSASGTVQLDGATIDNSNGEVSIDGGPVSAVNADLSATNNGLSITSSGELDVTGASLASNTRNIELVAGGDMRLNSTSLSTTNGAATANLGGENQVLYVQDAVIDDNDDTMDYSPNGVDVIGDPASGSVD